MAKTAANTAVTVEMKKTKETKGTVVFASENGAVKQVYIDKGNGFDDAAAITLTIEKAD